MIDGVALYRNSFSEPCLKLLVFRVDTARHDADRCATIDLFKAFQNWPQKGFIHGGIPHVINPQGDDGLNARFSNPLRGGQPWKLLVGVVGVAEFVKKSMGIGFLGDAWLVTNNGQCQHEKKNCRFVHCVFSCVMFFLNTRKKEVFGTPGGIQNRGSQAGLQFWILKIRPTIGKSVQ